MAKVSENTVEVLEELLAKAKDGKINGVGAVVSYADGDIGDSHGGYVSWTMVGRLEALKHRMIGKIG